jgi:hypothetical protein
MMLSALGSLMTVQGLTKTTIGVLAAVIVITAAVWMRQLFRRHAFSRAKPRRVVPAPRPEPT